MFRIAAGPRVGYGHLMRARALAECLDMDLAVSLRGGCAAREAAATVGRLVTETAALHGADVLVVDDPSPGHGGAWIARARRHGIPSVSVHDDGPAQDADLVVSGSLGVRRPLTTRPMLHGCRFYLLDRRIAEARRLRNAAGGHARPPEVLVALGGGQHVRRVAQPLVDAILAQCPGARISVAAGFSSLRRTPLQNATWLVAPGGLTRALTSADVAVVAGGVTLYEACALGVPSVGLSVVPEQRRAIRAFARAGAIIDAGAGSASRGAVRRAADGVALLVRSRRLRSRTAARARALVDGRGAERVAKCITAWIARVPHHA